MILVFAPDGPYLGPLRVQAGYDDLIRTYGRGQFWLACADANGRMRGGGQFVRIDENAAV